MKYRNLTILMLLTLLLVSIVPLSAQDALECEDGFRLVEHSGGETCIPENPQRIAIATDRNIGETVVALGIEPVAVAVKDEYAPFVQEAFNDFTAVTDLGSFSELNLELLLTVQPDLIIMQSEQWLSDPNLYDVISEIAPTIQIDPYTNVHQVNTDLGTIFGEEAANELNGLIDESVEQIVCAVGNPSEITVSSIFLRPDSVQIITQNLNRTHALLFQEAGFALPEQQAENIVLGEDPRLSLEEIDIADADVLFYLGSFGDTDEIDAILESPLWTTLNAVETGNVIIGDFRTWSVGGPLSTQLVAEEMIIGLEGLGLANPCETEESGIEATEEASASACEASFRLVEHVAGTTCVPETPERVATNVETAVTNLLLLGIQPVAGPEDQAGWNAPYVSLLPENVDINDIGDIGVTETTNLESLLLTEPDMILTYPYAGEEIYDDLSAVAPTVLIERGANSDWRERFNREAVALNREAEAAEVIARYEVALQNLSEFTDLTIAFVRRPDNGTFRMDVVGSFPGSVMEDAGLNLLTAPDGVGDTQFTGLVNSISEERLNILEDADLIITPDWREAGFSEEPDLAGLERLVGWDLLPAVQAGNVLVVPGPVYNGGNYAAAQLLLEAILDAVVQMEASE